MHRMRITQKGKKMNSKNQQKKKEIDWMITLVPLALIVALCIVFFFAPEQSNQVLGQIRFLFGDTFGTYYLVIGLGIFFLSLFLAGSKYGNIVLGKPDEKPKYSFFAWGCMMFTCGLAADILFYSFSEWILYATDPHIAELGSIQDWAGVFPLFHWSFIPWGFYLVLAVAFGFMLHVRKRNRQKYSEIIRCITRSVFCSFVRETILSSGAFSSSTIPPSSFFSTVKISDVPHHGIPYTTN